MKKRLFKYIFSLMLFSALFMLGCGGGGGQSVLRQESPETAVMRISSNWRTSTTSPSVVVDSNNRFIRQATTQETDSNTSSSSNGKIIYLRDLAGGDSYELKVMSVVKNDDNTAEVTCRFSYTNGSLIIVFKLVFDEEKWWLDDVVITEEELGENENFYYIYHLGPDNKDVFDVETLKGTIEEEVSAEGHERDDNDKYVYDPVASKETISGTISSSEELKLILYYKRRTADYVVYYQFLDENGNSLDNMAQKFSDSGFVGDEVDISKIEYTIPDDYAIEEEPKSLVINRDTASNEFVFKYKQKKKQEEEPDDDDENYTISGVLTDSKDSSKVIKNATIKFFIVDTNTPKGYSEFMDDSGNQVQITTDENGCYDTSSLESVVFKEGTYLLVVEAEGYESQTQTVTLPQSKTKTNVRTNISL